ncbi:MlaD family protein [Mycobacterium sp. pUA109]|uniref:MlaD family protein n=1 Tax=Mycobacterium sp. pUA109 TaxID=3238982 RepID=UPI00351AB6FF
MQPVTVLRDPRLWGAGALALITVAGLIAAMLYANPSGSSTITFYTDDAASVSPGITVRIAGITVGKVKDLSIEPTQVRVRATVDGTAFVGNQSTVEVRMLTVVGGYYVNIDSLGELPLGGKPIPKERVTMPYSLVRTLADATAVVDRVQTAPINEALNQVQEGLAGDNLNAVASVVDAGNKLAEVLDRQQGQVGAILSLSNEWIAELAGYRGQLQKTVEELAILEETMVLYGKNFAVAAEGLGEIVQRLNAVGVFYMNHRERFLAKIVHWQQIARSWADRTGLVTRILRRTRTRMMTTLDAQNSPPELLATDLCIPVPGSPC